MNKLLVAFSIPNNKYWMVFQPWTDWRVTSMGFEYDSMDLQAVTLPIEPSFTRYLHLSKCSTFCLQKVCLVITHTEFPICPLSSSSLKTSQNLLKLSLSDTLQLKCQNILTAYSRIKKTVQELRSHGWIANIYEDLLDASLAWGIPHKITINKVIIMYNT